MSICAPTPLLISTGPLSATRCQPCSMMAISGWQAASPGKVATALNLSPHPPCTLSHLFPHAHPAPLCLLNWMVVWDGGSKEGCGAEETKVCCVLTWHQLDGYDGTVWFGLVWFGLVWFLSEHVVNMTSMTEHSHVYVGGSNENAPHSFRHALLI